jgi:hypothetical protein
MKRILIARVTLTLVGVIVWAYGFRANEPNIRLVGIAILVVSIALRFVPKRWLGEPETRDPDAGDSEQP